MARFRKDQWLINVRTGDLLTGGHWSAQMSACSVALAWAVIFLGLAGCDGARPTDQQVQQQAAQTTADVKQGAKQAVAATQEAAGVAVRNVNDVAAGVKQGIHENAPPVDLNSSTQLRIATLPGISFDKAGQIVDGRPYTSSHQLVKRGLLTDDQYAKIATQVTVGK